MSNGAGRFKKKAGDACRKLLYVQPPFLKRSETTERQKKDGTANNAQRPSPRPLWDVAFPTSIGFGMAPGQPRRHAVLRRALRVASRGRTYPYPGRQYIRQAHLSEQGLAQNKSPAPGWDVPSFPSLWAGRPPLGFRRRDPSGWQLAVLSGAGIAYVGHTWRFQVQSTRTLAIRPLALPVPAGSLEALPMRCGNLPFCPPSRPRGTLLLLAQSSPGEAGFKRFSRR